MAAQPPDIFDSTVSPGGFIPIPPRSPLPKEEGKKFRVFLGGRAAQKHPYREGW
jgi:hypothetical protein